MDLFSFSKVNTKKQPLAERMRPKNLEEFIGQKHILGQGKILRNLIKNDRLTSIILYGPPGIGKTSLAYIISKETSSNFVKLNATIIGVKDIREYIKRAEDDMKMYSKKTIFFIDEIHSLKKGAPQDVLLEALEKGYVIIVGATTENPYFELNGALLSRSKVFELKPLNDEEICLMLDRVIKDSNRGFGDLPIKIDREALSFIANLSMGDLRYSINTLELLVLSCSKNQQGEIVITKKYIEENYNSNKVVYDSSGDNHYDIISAFIKSIRGSDANAALYWFARMILGGEDFKFIARRLIILASEDIGMEDPNALTVAVSAYNALMMVGMPEARLNLGEAIIYLANAPKSNSVIQAVDAAIKDAKENQYSVPNYLRDTHYSGARALGRGGYKNPHFTVEAKEQKYFPEEMEDKEYYS
ncbi:MAG: replication-associated recombination protein A [Clostridiaceae bacterium]